MKQTRVSATLKNILNAFSNKISNTINETSKNILSGIYEDVKMKIRTIHINCKKYKLQLTSIHEFIPRTNEITIKNESNNNFWMETFNVNDVESNTLLTLLNMILAKLYQYIEYIKNTVYCKGIVDYFYQDLIPYIKNIIQKCKNEYKNRLDIQKYNEKTKFTVVLDTINQNDEKDNIKEMIINNEQKDKCEILETEVDETKLPIKKRKYYMLVNVGYIIDRKPEDIKKRRYFK
jgi:hypothetical protein